MCHLPFDQALFHDPSKRCAREISKKNHDHFILYLKSLQWTAYLKKMSLVDSVGTIAFGGDTPRRSHRFGSPVTGGFETVCCTCKTIGSDHETVCFSTRRRTTTRAPWPVLRYRESCCKNDTWLIVSQLTHKISENKRRCQYYEEHSKKMKTDDQRAVGVAVNGQTDDGAHGPRAGAQIC